MTARMAYFGPALEKAMRVACPALDGSGSGYVYHLLDRWGRVLFIGKSQFPSQQAFQHMRKAWWREVDKVRIFSSADYHQLEVEDIRSLRPAFNAPENYNGVVRAEG